MYIRKATCAHCGKPMQLFKWCQYCGCHRIHYLYILKEKPGADFPPRPGFLKRFKKALSSFLLHKLFHLRG